MLRTRQRQDTNPNEAVAAMQLAALSLEKEEEAAAVGK